MVASSISSSTLHESELKRASSARMGREQTLQDRQKRRTRKAISESIRKEEAYVFKIVTWMLILLVLPAVLTIVYLAMNPETFMNDSLREPEGATWLREQRS